LELSDFCSTAFRLSKLLHRCDPPNKNITALGAIQQLHKKIDKEYYPFQFEHRKLEIAKGWLTHVSPFEGRGRNKTASL
jgi:hypothetical protein